MEFIKICSALPRVCLIFYVFNYLKRIPEGFFPSSTPHLSKLSISFKIEVSNQFPTLPHSDLCKTEPHSLDPNFPFLLSQQNIIKFNQDSFSYIPNLKSVFIQVISSLIDHFLLRLTRREPSPNLVGLATRLSVV